MPNDNSDTPELKSNLHPFLNYKIRRPLKENHEILALLADFRARGPYLRDQSKSTKSKPTKPPTSHCPASSYEIVLPSLSYTVSTPSNVEDRSSPVPEGSLEEDAAVKATTNSDRLDFVKGDEFGAYIAYFLSSQEYEQKLKDDTTSDTIELDMSDQNVSIHCVMFNPKEFSQLRRSLFHDQDGEMIYRESLWRCRPWTAPGGKSGSRFFITIDGRFILKEMSKLELQSFMAMSEQYFEYINKTVTEDRLSLLSALLGVYRIVYKNAETTSKYYFLVMQNLFYQRTISRRFDLKGSKRNRLAGIDSKSSVLMDEDLLRITCDDPLSIRSQSKTILNQAIDNDTRFLASLSIMDYSLLVGIDTDHHQLVLGIIDYVRPFTWDKKLERILKSIASTEMPTIVEPDLYRVRFCEAMNAYFESVTDHMDDT